VLCASWLTTAPWPARAYSSFGDYTRSIQEGGGGGRLFSGTPADGHGCDVCHRGAEGADLEVLGLPAAGYVPGQSYEIRFAWPVTTPHVAVMAELTDVFGRPAGITSLAPYGTWQEGERCEGSGFPAADVCRVGGAGDGCCRDLDPNRDACSFPGERSALWVLDCGSRFARVVWTAPDAAAGDVWFSSEMVTSNLQNDAVGDGVTSVRTRLRPAGATPEVVSAVGDCRAAPGVPTRSSSPVVMAMLAGLGVLRRWRRCASATGSHASGHE
jgi:hypothetical protein